MRNRGRIILAVLLLTVLLAVPAAAAEAPDYDRTGSISVTIKDQDGNPVEGGSLELIFVAEALWDGEQNRFAFTDEFADCGEKLDDGGVTRNGSPELAAALKKYADKNGITGTVVKLGTDGTARFADLKLGLYLISQKKAAEGYTDIEPILVSIPYAEDGKLMYDVDATPKPRTVTTTAGTTEPEETTKPEETTRPEESTEPETPPDIPQTGQLWWPVPLLAGVGAVLVLTGVLVRRKKEE
ncbi:MAG: LPXTG cell wall anchor domain-containing protein [Lachnospiraceae bacterium]|nr:LPXTG cell wall anchor domain-containing protein [Lachnospiraceae bacterium]